MTEQLTRKTLEMFSAVRDARIPENVQTLAEQSVVKSREAYTKMSAVANDGVKALEEVMDTVHAGTKALGERVLDYTAANAQTAFDAAQAMVRAKTIPEVLSLQAKFVQQQLTTSREQAEALFGLSTKVAQKTFVSLSSAATKTLSKA